MSVLALWGVLALACSDAGTILLDASSEGAGDVSGIADAETRDVARVDGGAIDASQRRDAQRVDIGASDTGACEPTRGSKTVRGTEIVTYVTEDGENNLPSDLTGRNMIALVEEPGGCFVEYAVETSTSGRFAVTGLPDRPYYLRMGGTPPVFVVSTESELDVGYALLGRSDVVAALRSTTEVRFDVTGLEPWQYGDDLEFFSLEAGVFAFGVPFLVDTPPSPGDTSLSFTLPWLEAIFLETTLIDAQRGDRAMLTQLSTRLASNGESYAALSKVFRPAAFTMMDGQTTTLAGPFEDVPTSSIAIDWRRSAYDPLSAAVPSGIDRWFSFFLVALPSPSRGLFDANPDLVIFLSSDPADLNTTLTYGNPLGSAFSLGVTAEINHAIEYGIGTATPALLFLATGIQVSTSTRGPLLLEPAVGPVRLPTINGRDATRELTGVGTSPVLAWSPPALGLPSGYEVTIIELTPRRGETLRFDVAIFETVDTRLRLPEGILFQGKTYVAQIRAWISRDFARAPFRTSYPAAISENLSERFTP